MKIKVKNYLLLKYDFITILRNNYKIGFIKYLMLLYLVLFNIDFVESQEYLYFDFKVAVEKSKEEKKKILIEFSSDLSGMCATFDKQLYENPEIVTYLRDSVNVLKLNYLENERLFRVYDVKVFPTFVVLDSNGVFTSKWTGYQ